MRWLNWSCAGSKQLAPAQDQLKPAAMIQSIPNQHMLFFFNGTICLATANSLQLGK